jgi:hypothetical protein
MRVLFLLYASASLLLLDVRADKMVLTNLQNTAMWQSVSSSQQYESEMKVAIDQQAQARVGAVDAGPGQTIGGYQRGSAQARGGVDQKYRLGLGTKPFTVARSTQSDKSAVLVWKPRNCDRPRRSLLPLAERFRERIFHIRDRNLLCYRLNRCHSHPSQPLDGHESRTWFCLLSPQ